MLREYKKYKAISFKQAWVIVISLHVFALIGFTQWTGYKAKLAKEFREAKKAQLLSETNLKQDWNNQHVKPKIVAVAPIPKPTPNNDKTSINPIEALTDTATDIKTAIAGLVQKDAPNEIKQVFLDGKKQLAQATQQLKTTPQTKNTTIPVTSPKPKQITVVTKKTAAKPVQQTIVATEPVTTVIKTTRTYFANGLDYRTEEQITERLSSHIKL